MRRLASAINIWREQRPRVVALVIGAAMTIGGTTGLLPITKDVHAQATFQGLNLVVAEQPPPPLPPIPFNQVPWGSGDLGKAILDYRLENNISPRSNVAVFEYLDQAGQKQLMIRSSARGVGHAERLIAKELSSLRIPNENITRIYSELEPCPNMPFGFCKTMITRGSPRNGGDEGGGGGGGDDPDPDPKPLGPFPNATVEYNYEYGETKESRDRGVKQLAERAKKWLESLQGNANAAFQDSGKTGHPSSTLVDKLSQQSASSLGGIDFSSLELRYLSDRKSGGGDGVQYAFTALPSTKDHPPIVGLRAVNQASDSFFVWLTLPTSKFTVNLNPNEPNRIIDADFGRTDAGRVLLEADLRLKKTVAQLIHPDTSLGSQFWAALKGNSSKRCLSLRQWIVPAPASVYENSDELYIINAPLSVKMETEYFQAHGLDNGGACHQQEKPTEEHNEAVFRSMILPQLEKAVNEAPEYSDLRRVYLSRVAAEWYRNRNLHATTRFAGLIDHGDVTPWESAQPWSPQEVFNRYVESFTKGELNVTRQTQDGNTIWTHTYVYGGVDFTNVTFQDMSTSDLLREHPELLKTVKQAFDHPMNDQKGKIWLGSTNVAPSFGQESGGHLPSYLILVMIGAAVWVVIWARSWWRLRRARQN